MGNMGTVRAPGKSSALMDMWPKSRVSMPRRCSSPANILGSHNWWPAVQSVSKLSMIFQALNTDVPHSAQFLGRNPDQHLPGFRNIAQQNRAGAERGAVRERYLGKHARTRAYQALVPKTGITEQNGRGLDRIERAQRRVMRDDASFVEEVEIADGNPAGHQHASVNDIALSHGNQIAIELDRGVDQIRKGQIRSLDIARCNAQPQLRFAERNDAVGRQILRKNLVIAIIHTAKQMRVALLAGGHRDIADGIPPHAIGIDAPGDLTDFFGVAAGADDEQAFGHVKKSCRWRGIPARIPFRLCRATSEG